MSNLVETQDVVAAVKPVGNVELLKWYVPLAKSGKTLAQVHEAYPGDIKKQSLSVKLSNMRKWARAKGIQVPELARDGGGRAAAEIDAEALAAELNLGFILDEGDESEVEVEVEVE
jgi:hypothetical protein